MTGLASHFWRLLSALSINFQSQYVAAIFNASNKAIQRQITKIYMWNPFGIKFIFKRLLL